MNIKETNRLLFSCFLLILPACGEGRSEGQIQITVTCAATTLDVMKSTQCLANATDSAGRPVDVDSFSWSSSDEELADVGFSTGRVDALARGSVTIRATAHSAGRDILPGEATLNIQGIIHSDKVTSNETWRAADNPHVVSSTLTVAGANNPQLTLEAGVVVRFKPYSILRVGYGSETGVLSVEGTEASPVLLTSNNDEDTSSKSHYWLGLRVTDASSIHLRHAVIEYVDGSNFGALYVNAPLFVDNVTVRRCLGAGVHLSVGGTFAPGSKQFRVSECNRPLSILADAVGSIPTDSEFTDNVSNAVWIDSRYVHQSQTWPALGVPYVLGDSLLVLGSGKPILTLAPGVEIRMDQDTSILVSDSGALVAQGTATRPIRFVANSSKPSPGFWRGLTLYNSQGSRLDHVSVSHAGPAALTVPQELGAFVTRSEFTHSSGCGLLRGLEVTTDFTLAEYGNTFSDNALGAQCQLQEDLSALKAPIYTRPGSDAPSSEAAPFRLRGRTN